MTRRSVLVVLAVLIPLRLPAQTPAPEHRVRTQIDLGYVQAAGNTRLTTLHLAEQLVYHVAPWKLTQTFAIVNGSTGGVETANNLKAGLRGDYEITGRLRAYLVGTYERDRFAGLAHRLSEEAGLSRSLTARPRDTLDLEAGLGWNQEKGDTTASRNYASSRVATRFRHVFRANTFFELKDEVLSNLKDGADTRVNAEASLVAPISSHIALKLGYAVRYDHQPEPGRRTTDTITSAGLQVVF